MLFVYPEHAFPGEPVFIHNIAFSVNFHMRDEAQEMHTALMEYIQSDRNGDRGNYDASQQTEKQSFPRVFYRDSSSIFA